MSDTTQWEHPDIPIGVLLVPHNVREVDLNTVADDPESTNKNSIYDIWVPGWVTKCLIKGWRWNGALMYCIQTGMGEVPV